MILFKSLKIISYFSLQLSTQRMEVCYRTDRHPYTTQRNLLDNVTPVSSNVYIPPVTNDQMATNSANNAQLANQVAALAAMANQIPDLNMLQYVNSQQAQAAPYIYQPFTAAILPYGK